MAPKVSIFLYFSLIFNFPYTALVCRREVLSIFLIFLTDIQFSVQRVSLSARTFLDSFVLTAKVYGFCPAKNWGERGLGRIAAAEVRAPLSVSLFSLASSSARSKDFSLWPKKMDRNLLPEMKVFGLKARPSRCVPWNKRKTKTDTRRSQSPSIGG